MGTTTTSRQTNIELLRIISMFMVLMVHFNFLALGKPSLNDLNTIGIATITRVFIESLSICCVNVFVLISGFFGILPSNKGLQKFLFQCIFFAVLIYIANGIVAHDFSFESIQSLLNFNWFIISYLGLYSISPILNAFVENASKSTQKKAIITFFIFQITFGFATKWCQDFNMGYSILSFAGLYLIARYINVWKPSFAVLSKRVYLLIFFSMATALTLCWYLNVECILGFTVFSYNNPLIIIEALALLLFFLRIDITCSFVNKVAKSSFAVFLFHTNYHIGKAYLYPYLNVLYNNNLQGGVDTQVRCDCHNSIHNLYHNGSIANNSI